MAKMKTQAAGSVADWLDHLDPATTSASDAADLRHIGTALHDLKPLGTMSKSRNRLWRRQLKQHASKDVLGPLSEWCLGYLNKQHNNISAIGKGSRWLVCTLRSHRSFGFIQASTGAIIADVHH